MTVACWGCGSPVDGERRDAVGYARCDTCGLRFAPSGQAPREAYDSGYFEAYKGGDYFATEQVRRHEARERLRLLGAPQGDLLEVGAAAGFFLDEARRQGWRPVGVEPAEDAARFARDELGLDVRTGFAEDVDLGEGAFDAVCMWHTLEHIPDPLALLQGLRGALRPGGLLAVEVPNGGSRAAALEGDSWFALEPDVHVAQWTPRALSALLARAGFVDGRVETVPFLTYVPGAMSRAPRRVKLALRQRAWLRDPHPEGHELLRGMACAPR